MAAPLLLTDGYKFSMAEAGWPLRRETFYYSHRKGGLQVLPFDVEAEVKKTLPEPTPGDWEFLSKNDYELGSAVKAALADRSLKISALPKFAVFNDREPVFSVTGPSALVSWLEPLALQWSYRIQVATLALRDPAGLAAAVATVTCEAQKELVLETLDAVGVKAPTVNVDSDGYVARVRARVAELVEIVKSPARIFEVGLRAASCPEQHLLALEGAKQAGLLRTSSVHGARQLGLTPVGTMGHEHIQRYGSDEAAFRAMVERRFQRSSFLLDTFDTITSGIPTAYKIIVERKGQGDSIRYDSGDKVAQYRFAIAEAKRLGIRPVQILEDSFDIPQTKAFEALREEVGWKPEEQVYGYGGFIVAQTAGTPLTRDRVAAVFKLSQTGATATMKFGNEGGGGKQSVPGRPVLFRRRAGASGAFGVVGQEGEATPEGYLPLTGAPARTHVGAFPEVAEADRVLVPSPQTRALVDELSRWRK
ncbi:MAG: nicotinate phosphoribosyltransferase [Archangium sp.]|nr:nicotinate phosphoribosyltransferase [Archangium sp.]